MAPIAQPAPDGGVEMSLGKSVNPGDAGGAGEGPAARGALALLVMPFVGLAYIVLFPFLLPILLFRFALREALARRAARGAGQSDPATLRARVRPSSAEAAAPRRASRHRRFERPPARRVRGPTPVLSRRRLPQPRREALNHQGPAQA